jgi:ABC-2 type transport system permease protein
MLQPAIPFIIYFMVGMMATSACSFSLEGKNYWILQSLPISKKKICQGKMLFHICLTVPSMAFSTLCFCISAKVSVPNTVLFLLLGFLLCCFSTVWGCVCGISHMRLDWENEVEVIKQGSAVVFYLFPNLIVSVGLIILSVFLGTRMNHSVLTLLMMAITAVPTALCYIRAVRLSKTIL